MTRIMAHSSGTVKGLSTKPTATARAKISIVEITTAGVLEGYSAGLGFMARVLVGNDYGTPG